MKAQSTHIPKPAEYPEKWFVVDAEGQIVGRLAARVAKVLRGKNTPLYTPHLVPNRHVIIVNAEKAVFSSDKVKTKKYQWHTDYRTGLKTELAEHLLQRKPEEVLRRAIRGMVPKNRLGRTLMRYLRIYKGPEHPHQAQQPEALAVRTRHLRAKV